MKTNKQGERNRYARVKTGSIALRIALSSALGLAAAFAITDAAILALEAWPSAPAGAGGWEFLRSLFSAAAEALLDPKFRALYRIEGGLIVVLLVWEIIRVRRQLRPLDEMAEAARRLSGLDVAMDERFAKLESAIDRVSPAAENAAVSTGDKELEGLEAAVNKLMGRMRESYRQQVRFVSDASHELRTPIAVIRGYADMLDRWGKDDARILSESIEAIRAESENMQHLVEQLLFLARGDSGRTPIDIKPFDLCAMVREVCEESAMIDEKHVYRADAEGSIEARGDVSLLKQTARILVENARKYSADGTEITISAKLEGLRPCFSVQDGGIGIGKDALPHMFERFYREDGSRSKQTGGTGLGLAIAKWIVDRHGGSFSVLSVKGMGTRISVIL